MIDQALLTEIQYALLEPPDGGQSWPSEIWTHDEAVGVVAESERQLLRKTHLLVTRVELPIVALATSVSLPSDWLATAHLVWRDLVGRRTPLAPIDLTEADLGSPTWETVAAQPQAYRDSGGESLTLQLVPTPDTNGTIELLYIAAPPEVNGNGRAFTVPDEYLSAVKYGALSMLLRKVGRLLDHDRATYCEQREALTHELAEIVLGGFA